MARKKRGAALPPEIDDRTDEQKARSAARAARRSGKAPPAPAPEPEAPAPAQAEESADSSQHVDPEPEPACVAASVTSLDEARAKREELQAAVAKELGPKDPVELPMSEVEALKLEAAQSATKLARAAVVDPLSKAAQARLDAAVEELRRKHIAELTKHIDTALAENEAFQQATDRETRVINDMLDEFESKAPEGYAVKLLEWEKSRVVLEHDPARRGQRFKLPG